MDTESLISKENIQASQRDNSSLFSSVIDQHGREFEVPFALLVVSSFNKKQPASKAMMRQLFSK